MEPTGADPLSSEPDACWSSSVAPGDPESATTNTLALIECNDCTLCRVAAAMNQEIALNLPAGFDVSQPPIKSDPLALNVVGLRIEGTVSNKFDDRLVVFYRPIHLASPTTVDDPDSPALASIDVPAVEQFLASPHAAKLRMNGAELPGEPSVDTESRECRLHSGWKVLVYPITTDPGWEKSADGNVPVGNGGYLAQGRAQLQPGVHEESHRLHVHHGGRVDGYVAGSQTGSIAVLRGYTVGHLVAELNEAAAKWLQAFAKKSPGVRPDDAEVTAYLADTFAGYGTILAVRDGSLTGASVGTAAVPKHTIHEISTPDPKHPDATVTTYELSVDGLFDGDAKHDDTRVIAVEGSSTGINLHASNPEPSRPSASWDPNVYTWSEGCQVQKGMRNFEQFRALFELTKRARCPKRKAGTCISLVSPDILPEDVIASHFEKGPKGAKYTWQGYAKLRLTGTPAELRTYVDALLEERYAAGFLDGEYAKRIQADVDAITFDVTGPLAPPIDPKPTPLEASSSAKLAAVVEQNLLPADAATRKQISTRSLRSKLDASVADAVARDEVLRAKIDAAVADLPAGRKKSTVLGHADIVAARKAQSQVHLQEGLDFIAESLREITANAPDKKQATLDQIWTTRTETAAAWTDQGLEACDHVWQCDERLDYILAEVEKSFADEIDLRPKRT